jgi:hypothetical protein
MTAHEQMVVLAWTTCSITVIIMAMLLLPGITEIRDRVEGVWRRAERRRSKGARHRLATAPPQTDPDPGHRVQDPSSQEATA